MNSEDIIDLIRDTCEDTDSLSEINEDSALVGGNIDSMALVQLCIALEEKAIELGFEFDWTSEKALSSLNSIFKNPLTLSEEYNKQKKSNK